MPVSDTTQLRCLLVQRDLEIAVRGVQFSKTGGLRRDALIDIRHRRERMHWANDILIQFGIVRDQANTFALALRHEEGRRAPICRFIARNDDA